MEPAVVHEASLLRRTIHLLYLCSSTKLIYMQISLQDALDKLIKSSKEFLPLFNHGSLTIEIYKPKVEDHQDPHEKDEVYIIISGTGEFINGETSTTFKPGDFLFVPAGVNHQFKNFTEDFATWVIFYGPLGGEKVQNIV